MTTKQSDQEYAAKLILLYMQKLAHNVIAINRGDYTKTQLKKIIKDFEQSDN